METNNYKIGNMYLDFNNGLWMVKSDSLEKVSAFNNALYNLIYGRIKESYHHFNFIVKALVENKLLE